MFQELLLELQNLGEKYVLTLANNLFIQQGFELLQVSHLLTAVAMTSSFPVTGNLTVAPLVSVLEHVMCYVELYLLRLVGKR